MSRFHFATGLITLVSLYTQPGFADHEAGKPTQRLTVEQMDAIMAKNPGGTMDGCGGLLCGDAYAKMVERALGSPLGSRENPVRVFTPRGQHAYLQRLKCSDSSSPDYKRVGNFGAGMYGTIIDGYEVICTSGTPKKSMIFMDMSHRRVEREPVPGFTKP